MIGVFPHIVQPGQFVKFRGHNVSDAHYLQWWRVTSTSDGRIELVNRHGKTSRIGIEQARRLAWKFLVWEPGDDRNDESIPA